MRQIIPLILSLCIACSSSTSEENKLPNNVENTDSSSTENLQKGKSANFFELIPPEYILYHSIDKESLGASQDSSFDQNYFSLENKSFEARLYKDLNGEFIAVNNVDVEDDCTRYQAFLLRKNKDGFWEDQFNVFYPNLSLYSFYSFEDEETKQLEGDEETVFAGYYFDLKSADKLGIQFMFCNLRDAENTKYLNMNAKRIYKDIHE